MLDTATRIFLLPGIRWARENKLSLHASSDARLRKHADYQRVYKRSRKHFSASMTYFFVERFVSATVESGVANIGRRTGQVLRQLAGPRVGLTAGRVLGKAVDRNRIKRRMREAIRVNLVSLTRDVDVILHPRRTVMNAEFAGLQKEVAKIFSIIQKSAAHPGPDQQGSKGAPRG